MTFVIHPNNTESFVFQGDDFKGIVYGFFTRKGGVSEGQYASLNLGGSIGDTPENVVENRRRVFESLGRKPFSLFDVWQIHGSNVTCTEQPRDLQAPHIKSDAIFTDNPEVTLLMRFADCVPIILYDPIKQVVGIVHAGWIGTVNQIVGHAIDEITRYYGCQPRNIVAGIGPSIGPDHYIVREDVLTQAKEVFQDKNGEILSKEDGVARFNLWKANEHLLRKCGVERILQANECTACDTSRWFSHRAENGKTGRFATVVGLMK